VNGILFNHESPLRGENFVTKKIVRSLVRIKHGLQSRLTLGNLDSVRDWGHAEDYVIGIHKMLNQERPVDLILATGETLTVREFLVKVMDSLGIKATRSGDGMNERFIGIGELDGKTIVSVSGKYFRPIDVHRLKGDSMKARAYLNWKPTRSVDDLIHEMVNHELKILSLDK
jgi:GDPmannose 4,6-dehydratase